MTDWYSALHTRYAGSPQDRRGNVYIECPVCNRPERDRKCAFHPENGWHCFVCGSGSKSLYSLARLVGQAAPPPDWKPPRRAAPPPPPEWTKDPARWLAQYLEHPDRLSLWQSYRPYSLETIARFQFGAGVLPATRCPHLRIVYPVYDLMTRRIVSFRGRRLTCDCPKWINAAGSRAALWGAGLLVREGRGKTVFICESPPDAALLMQKAPGVVAVASSNGAGTFYESWAELIVQAGPGLVVIALDNDLPGQVAGAEWEQAAREWRAEHPQARTLPVTNGPRIANMLSGRVPLHLLEWSFFNAPAGADVGWLLSQVIEVR